MAPHRKPSPYPAREQYQVAYRLYRCRLGLALGQPANIRQLWLYRHHEREAARLSVIWINEEYHKAARKTWLLKG